MRILKQLRAIAFAAVCIGTSVSQGAVIYFDDFSGSNANPLSGTMPDTTIGTNAWTAGTNLKADGGVSGASTATIPFQPESGKIYTLSVEFSVTSTASSWIGFGFVSAIPGNYNTGNAWAAGSGSGIAVLWGYAHNETASSAATKYGNTFLGLGNVGSQGGSSLSAAPTSFKVELNTQNATWETKWFFDGSPTPVRTESFNPSGSFPNINYIGFASNGAQGKLNSYSLTAVPEPHSCILIVIGSLGMAWLRRRE